MKLKNMSIGKKLAIGFGCLIVLLAITGYAGFDGIKTVSHALFVVGDEEAPVVDMAYEMKIALLVARDAMAEFKIATAAIATDNEERLGGIENTYNQAMADFDRFAGAILEGATLDDGTVVIQTDNEELAALIQQADELHNDKFQAAAREMMLDGKELLQKKAEADKSIDEMEQIYDEIYQDASAVEEMISSEIAERARVAAIGTEARVILREEVPLADMANELKISLAQTRIFLEEYVQKRNPEELDELAKEYQEWVKRFDEDVSAILEGGIVDDNTVIATDNRALRDAVEELDGDHTDFQKKANALMAAHRAAIEQSNKAEAAMIRLGAFGEEAARMLTQVEQLAGEEMSVAKDEGRVAKTRAFGVIVGVTVFSLLVGIVLGTIITTGVLKQLGADPSVVAEIARRVGVGDLSIQFDTHRKTVRGVMAVMKNMVSNLKSTAQIAEQIAKGDLNVSVNILSDKDTLGKSLAAMVAKLREVVVDVKGAAGNVASGSQVMSSSSEEMSQGSTEQAAAAEEASTSMEQMAANIRQNADNALQTEKIAVKAAADAQESGKAVTQALAAIQEIANKITVIEEIARQTHMLSLNATIEAAKAQDYGKGFGVVAAEVRALAERSRTAATEINGLANSSVTVAARAGEMLTKLVPDIQKTAELVQEISAASSEQSSGAEQINKAIQQLDQVIQQNSTVSEEIAATSEELASQAEHLQSTIEFFKVSNTVRKTSNYRKQTQGVLQTRPATTESKAKDEEIPLSNEQGNGKPAGPVFHMGPNDVQGDERDAEFERF